MADGNPFAPAFMNPNASRMGLYDLRMMSAANRAEAPFERMHSYGHQGLGGNPMLAGIMGGMGGPDYSQFTYDPRANAAASQALAPYGLSPLEANQVQRNTILPNTGFFGRHPALSGALEGAMYGGLAAHGGATPGESIQGALEGIIGGRQLQRAAYNRQFARPFEAAGSMEHLEDLQQKRDLQAAQIKRYNDESEIQQERVDLERQKNELGRPVPDATGTWVLESRGGAPKLGPDMLVQGSEPRWTHLEEGGKTTRAGANVWAGLGHLEPYARALGYTDPNKMTPAQWDKVNKKYDAAQSTLAYGRGRGGTEGRLSVPGELSPQQKEHVDTVRSQINKLDSRDETSRLRQEVMLDSKFAGKSLGEINTEVENRREAKRQTLQGQIDTIMNPQQAPPEAKGAKKVLVEGRDF